MAKRPKPSEAKSRGQRRSAVLTGLMCLLVSSCGPTLNPLVVTRDNVDFTKIPPDNPFVSLGSYIFTDDYLRDSIVLRDMSIEDDDFKDYSLRVWTLEASTITGMDLATLGLTAASSLTGQILAKALAATATAVTGARSAVDKNFLYGRTIDALMFSMVSTRATIRAHILSCLKLPSSQYDLATAMYDVVQYREAGRLQNALANVAALSSVATANPWAECPPPKASLAGTVVVPPTKPEGDVPIPHEVLKTSDASMLLGYVEAPNIDTAEKSRRKGLVVADAVLDERFKDTKLASEVINGNGPNDDARRAFVVQKLRSQKEIPTQPAS